MNGKTEPCRHPLLAELVRRHLGRGWEDTAGSGELSGFIASLDEMLLHAEAERANLEQSMADANARLAADSDSLRDSEQSYRYLFELLQATLEATGDAILVIDLDGRVTSCNRRFLDLWSVDESQINDARARHVAVRLLEQIADPEPYSRAVATVLADPAAEHSGLMNLVDGRVIEHSSRPQMLGEEIVGRVWCFRDVTERVVLEQQLAHQAYHDALTGLANRGRFQQRCEEALDRSLHSPEQVGILLIDLDGFKVINDSLGHAAGDALLVQVAHRLLNATRGCDTVARLGGDEFAVLIEGVRTNRDVIVVAERILGSMRAPFFFGESPALVGASIGIARGDSLNIAPPVDVPALQPSWQRPDDEDRCSQGPMRFSKWLRNADLALYHAKSQGKARLALFEPQLYSAAAERLALERALHAAMDRGEFHLVYQPIVDLSEQSLVGVEALLRWEHPEFGNIPPDKFIHVAEDTGLIVAIGRWVLETACRQAARWTRQGLGGKPISVTINISGRQLRDPEFEHTVVRVLEHCGLPGSQLVLELTESTVIDRPDVVLERLNALKRHGVRFAVDDFGTGYSALSYLQTFPIDVLKIDRTFVENVARGGSHTALAGAIVALGNALSLRTVAEGVESEQQRAQLKSIGCEFGQGFLFAHPLTAEEIDARFAAASAA